MVTKTEFKQFSNLDKYAVRASVENPSVKFKSGGSVEQTCSALTNGNSLEIEWYNPRGQLIRNDVKYSINTQTTSESPLSQTSTLRINNLYSSDAGRYECRAKVDKQRESSKFELISEESEIGIYFTF